MKWKIENELKYRKIRILEKERITLEEVLKITKEELLRIIAYFFINFRVNQSYLEVIVKSRVEKMFGIKSGVMDSITGMPLDSHSYYPGDYQIRLNYYEPIHGYQSCIIYL